MFFDFDGTLSDIVNDPDAARPVAGAAEALQKLGAHYAVAILSGRDLADVVERVGVPGIWYAGAGTGGRPATGPTRVSSR